MTARAIELISVAGDRLRLRVECSAGFYVRALARDLGERIGIGACLEALIRTRSGSVTLADARPLATIEADPMHALGAVQPMSGMLQWLTPLTLTDDGVRRARHGCDLRPVDFDLACPSAPAETAGSAYVRLLDRRGDLVGVAEPARASALLHPAVVLV